jgi:hypothetical protein
MGSRILIMSDMALNHSGIEGAEAIREIVRITICASAACTNHLVPPHFDAPQSKRSGIEGFLYD